MKRILPFIFIFTFTLNSFATETIQLLFDNAHDHAFPQRQVAWMDKLNFEIQINTQPITAETLKDFQVLYIRLPRKAFTTAEKETIIAYVKDGGSLLLVMDEEKRSSLSMTGVNDIIAPFGLKITPDTQYLHNCGGIAKASEINPIDREIAYSGGRAVEGGSPFAFRLDKEGNMAESFAAFKKTENNGRIVVMAEAMASLLLGSPEGIRLTKAQEKGNAYWGKDSAVFMEEVLAWLTSRDT